MRNAAVAGVVAGVVVVGGVVAVASSDYLRAVVTDAVEPLPSSTARAGALDPAAGRYLDAVAAKDADAVAAAFAPDAVVVDVGREIRGRDAIRAWAEAEVIGGTYTLLDHTPACSVLDGRPVAVTGGVGGTVWMWDLVTAEEISTFTGHLSAVVAVACSVLDERPVAVTGSYDGTVRVWDLVTAEEISRFTGHTGVMVAVACSVLDGRPVAVTGSYDGTARIWDLETTDESDIFDFRDIGSAAVGPGGELLLATGWDLVVLDRTAKH
jgi:WD40 repeat protein